METEKLVKQEVTISCSEHEAKLVTRSISQVRLIQLCNVTDSLPPIMNEMGKKAKKILIDSNTMNHIPEVREKVSIPTGSAKFMKIPVEENWKETDSYVCQPHVQSQSE